ncbi:hypothetical protein CXG81DRAFT_29272 [Caulochytrium protostelioides]|uniref:3-hydroxyisobutyrate dehydrogenase n=1 Tax=Caulochytrium protostelioides TaxID=1555241 RepID=A0A4P9XE43_9FUNG|nr:hypothetical protein CXG81DRAFT_29272 [Caulochytrium protostelioides]|eukprot:RKP03420.1 hypothetical protein CXG81DRAFT_29272 [Caulochytrium protostelioides]
MPLADAAAMGCPRRAPASPSTAHLPTAPVAAPVPREIGFVGLGNMGYNMAANLYAKTCADGGSRLTVYDTVPAARERFVAQHPAARAAATSADVLGAADVVVTMLPDGPALLALLRAAGDALRRDTLLLDCSTIDVAAVQAAVAFCADRGAHLVDAPVSGGVGGAQAGTLTFMVGAAASDGVLPRAAAVLAHMGQRILPCGARGAGQVAKICNNLVLGITMLAVSEATALGLNHGLTPQVLAGIMNVSSGRSWVTEMYHPVPGVQPGSAASRGYTGGFGAKLMAKDLRLACEAAAQVGMPLPLGEPTRHYFDDVVRDPEYASLDFSAVYRYMMQRPKQP